MNRRRAHLAATLAAAASSSESENTAMTALMGMASTVLVATLAGVGATLCSENEPTKILAMIPSSCA